MEELKSKIRTIVQGAISDAGMNLDVDDDLPLIESGLLDSLSIISVVQRLQQAFDVDVQASDVTAEVFGSVNKLTAFVASRSPARP